MFNFNKFLIVLAFVGLSAGAVNAQTSGSCGANGNNLTWELTGTGDNLTLTISGTGAMTNYSYNSAPWYSQSGNIKTLALPSGMTTIGNSAFSWCSGLTSVTIPNSVETIGISAFSWCSGLTSVIIGNSVTSISIGDEAFYGCGFTGTLTIPNSVISIGNGAFSGCSGLTSVTIPNSVTSIGGMAFSGCSRLTSIDVDESNMQYSSIDGVLFNKAATTLITYPIGKQSSSFIIPSSVTSIGNSAFSGCSGLSSVTIPNSVITIGGGAFSGCSGLISVTVNWNTPLVINSDVFYDLTLSNITLHVPCGSSGLYAVAAVWQNFNVVELSITATAGSNGSISPSGITNASCGEDKTFTFTPNTGYEIDVVLIDDVPNATAKENGEYTFENVTDNHTISVTFKATVGIDDIVETDNYPSLRIYPNPAQNKLTIDGRDLQINRVEICDLAGRAVLLPSFGGVGGGLINVSALPAGIYLIKIHTDKGIVTRKVVKN